MPGTSLPAAAPAVGSMPEPGLDYPAGAAQDDRFLAALLIRMWSLASGRTLRSDVLPEELSSEELIRFWADDLSAPSGRHTANSPAGAAR